MLMLLDSVYLNAKSRFTNFVENFKKDEMGVSAIVATVLLILIVVLLAALFWEKIYGWFDSTWKNIIGEANKIGTKN